MLSSLAGNVSAAIHGATPWYVAGPQPFPLLSLPADAVALHLIPQLQPRDKASLALVCQCMRQVVHGAAPKLSLDRPLQLCAAAQRGSRLAAVFRSLQEVCLTCHDPHDIMYAAPLLVMQLLSQLPKLHSVSVVDAILPPEDQEALGTSATNITEGLASSLASMLTGTTAATATPGAGAAAAAAAVEPEEGGWCDCCEQETTRHDLAGFILSLRAVLGDKVTAFRLTTQIVSEAECQAIAQLTSLTSLTFNAEQGMRPGALSALRYMPRLRALSLGDADGNSQADVDAMVGLVCQLTELHMGYGPRLQPPVLRALQQAARDASGSGGGSGRFGLPGWALGGLLGSQQQQQQQQQPAPDPPGGKHQLKVLSVNIDAEEGEEILREMSMLTALESLLVDATDEFDFDPGFQPFSHFTNIQKLVITMPVSLANTESLQACSNLHQLHLISLPSIALGRNSLQQVTQLELLQAPQLKTGINAFAPFPNVSMMIIRNGADDNTLSTVGKSMLRLRRLELYQLPLGYTQSGIQALAHLPELRELLLELAESSSGHARGWVEAVPGVHLASSALHLVSSSSSSAAGGTKDDAGSHALSAFVPPAAILAARVVPQLLSEPHSRGWFPQLRQLQLLGEVVACDSDLLHLTHLRHLRRLLLHLVGRRKNGGDSISQEGIWKLVEAVGTLEEVEVEGALRLQVQVAGRMPGVYSRGRG